MPQIQITQEDRTKKKLIKKLRVTEGSLVKSGGHQMAKIAIIRSNETHTQEAEKMTLWDKTKTILGFSRAHPKTYAEIREKDKLVDELWEKNNTLRSSLCSIMESMAGQPRIIALKQSLNDFVIDVEKDFPKMQMVDLVGEEYMRSAEEIINTVDSCVTDDLSPNGRVIIDRAIQNLKKKETNMTTEKPEVEVSRNDTEIEVELKRKFEEQEELVRTLTAKLDEAEKVKVDEEIKRNADSLAGFGKSGDDFAIILRQLDDSGKTILTELVAAAKAQTNSDNMTTEIGRSTAQDELDVKATEEIQRIAKELCEKDASLSIEAARVLVRRTNPQLAAKAAKGQ